MFSDVFRERRQRRTLVQVAALGLLFAAAMVAALQDRVNANPISPPEYVLYVVGLVSTVLGLLSAEDGPLSYSVGLFGAVILASIVARAVSTERLLDIGAVVMVLCVLATVAVERGTLATSLSASVGRNGLLRFTPLGTHPNLTGYMFGAGSILTIRRVLISRSWLERIVMAGATLLSWAFILAASARSSILALFFAALVALIFERRVRRMISWRLVAVVVVVVAVSRQAWHIPKKSHRTWFRCSISNPAAAGSLPGAAAEWTFGGTVNVRRSMSRCC